MTTDARRSAYPCLIAGLLFLVHGLAAPWAYAASNPNSAEAKTTGHIVLTAILLAACVALLMGLPAIVERLRARSKRLAAVGGSLAVPGVALYMGVVFILLFVFPFLAQAAPAVLNAEVALLNAGEGTTPMLLAFVIGTMPLKVGLLLLGLAAIRSGRPWRGPGVTLVLALPVAAIHNQVLPWDFLGAWAVTGFAIAWFGVLLMRQERNTGNAPAGRDQGVPREGFMARDPVETP